MHVLRTRGAPPAAAAPAAAAPAARPRRRRSAARCSAAVEAPPAAAPAAAASPAAAARAALVWAPGLAPAPPHPTNIFPDLALPPHDPAAPGYDVAVVGAGPAGLAVAARVAAAGFSVAVVDPAPRGPWINNYGVWCDEFEAMGLDDCFDTVWAEAVVLLDSTPAGAKTLARPYARVDRPKLKRKLLERCAAAGVRFAEGRAAAADHAGGRSTVRLAGGGGALTAALVVDATGHARTLVEYAPGWDPGYQGAYGIVAEVEAHPFDVGKMLFMDWRSDHLAPAAEQPGGDAALAELRARNEALPTFLYAMPFSATRIFLEETSLVARPIVPFPELKARLEARLAHLGIRVVRLEEEEYCAIPMGGALPRLPQRVVGCGGTAGMVHPSTGYMAARVLGAAPAVADAIVEALSAAGDKAVDAAAGAPRAPRTEAAADAAAAAVWAAMWPPERLRQREFFSFGMEVLLKLDLTQTRQFFAAFFSLSAFHWHGFLSSRLSLPELIGFGLALFARSSNEARVNLLSKGLPGLLVMLGRIAATFK